MMSAKIIRLRRISLALYIFTCLPCCPPRSRESPSELLDEYCLDSLAWRLDERCLELPEERLDERSFELRERFGVRFSDTFVASFLG